jgi:hypothetical protein
MTGTLVFAALGAKALWLMYLWLLSSIIASELSRSKGYGEKPGLGTGLLLSALAPIIWLIIPPKDDLAEWHTRKPWQRRHKPREAEMAAAMAGERPEQASGSTVDEAGGAGSRPGESRD